MDGLLKNSRDNARTPMHWNNSVNNGFNDGSKTWLAMNEKFKNINVYNQENDDKSVLNYYKKLIKLRKQYKDILIDGEYVRWDKYEVNDDIFIYEKSFQDKKIIVILNLGANEISFDKYLIQDKKILISNYENINNVLRPYEAIVVEE